MPCGAIRRSEVHANGGPFVFSFFCLHAFVLFAGLYRFCRGCGRNEGTGARRAERYRIRYGRNRPNRSRSVQGAGAQIQSAHDLHDEGRLIPVRCRREHLEYAQLSCSASVHGRAIPVCPPPRRSLADEVHLRSQRATQVVPVPARVGTEAVFRLEDPDKCDVMVLCKQARQSA